MSPQFGRWNFSSRPFTEEDLGRVDCILAGYGPDGMNTYLDANTIILYRYLHLTKESPGEAQPYCNRSGSLIAWDGCLDNRFELIGALGSGLTSESSDVQISATALERWGLGALARFAGDWCVSIWNPKTLTLLLAKDPIGSRHLFYFVEKEQITWSTILDSIVLLAAKTFSLSEEYIAGAYSLFPAAHLTPYVGILSVPPGCFVQLTREKQEIHRFWDFEPSNRICYRSDAEYEEHFRYLFVQGVQRKLRSRTPVLAELSGGMDSSAIVCMADRVIAEGRADVPRLDTVSYYDDTEPNWNEKPYFAAVERQRGRVGCHIDVGNQNSFFRTLERTEFHPTPFCGRGNRSEASRRLEACIKSEGHRVLLAGTGGDEVLGGSPDPLPELRDLFVAGRFRTLAHQLKLWALEKRQPWLHLYLESLRAFLPPRFGQLRSAKRFLLWLEESFIARNWTPLAGYPSRSKVLGPPPSFQENLETIRALQRQLACASLAHDPAYEKRYPILDRDLLQFLCSVPREQLVRPGQRRSLLRRSLRGIVPTEILERRRKAFIVRTPMTELRAEWPAVQRLTEHMLSVDLGIVNPNAFAETLREARQGSEVLIVSLVRTLTIEIWLRNLRDRQILATQLPFGSRGNFIRHKSRTRDALAIG